MDAHDDFVDVIVDVDVNEILKEYRERFLGTHRRHAFRSQHPMMAFSSTSTLTKSPTNSREEPRKNAAALTQRRPGNVSAHENHPQILLTTP